MGCVYISRDVIFDEGVFPFAHLSSTAAARYSPDVLLLPNESLVRASIEAPMDNSHVISCLSNPIFVTNQQLPQRIPEQVPDPLRRANSEVDPILSLATTTAPTAGSGADFHADPVMGMLPPTAPTSGVPSATPTAPHDATRLPPASTPPRGFVGSRRSHHSIDIGFSAHDIGSTKNGCASYRIYFGYCAGLGSTYPANQGFGSLKSI
jgi:hypothetical protein